MGQLILAMVIWGTLGLFVLKSGLGSIELAFFRCLIGACILAPYSWYKGFFLSELFHMKNIFPVVLGGVFVVLNWILLFEAFKYSSITLGNVSYYMQPVFLVILGRIIFKEEISFIKGLFIFFTLSGVLMTMNLSVQSFQMNKIELLGVVCALMAGFFYSIATLIAKKMQKMRPEMMTLLQVFSGMIILFPFVDFQAMQWTWETVFYLLVLGVVHTVLAFIFYYQAVKILPTTTIAVISYLDPIVAIFTDLIFYDRCLNIIQILGIVLTLVSSYYVINPIVFRKKRIKTSGSVLPGVQ